MCLGQSSGINIKNLTQNSGIIPINLGPARLQRNDYTIVHFYDLNPLVKEFENLNTQYNDLLSTVNSKSANFSLDLVNYKKIIYHLRTVIVDKINNIQLGQPSVNNRKRRGLYNSLGSAIKFVTGNLDAEDGDRFDKIIESLNHKTTRFQAQTELQFSLNQQTIQKFEERIRNLEHNDLTLKEKILQLGTIVETEQSRLQNTLSAKELFNQLILLYNTIISVLQDVENSITFCSINTFHPSIIKPQELLAELEKLNKEYKHQSSFKFKNLPKLQKIMDVRCKIDNMKILYFLSFPVNFETKFDLYLLLAIPSFLRNEYRTIIPNTKYLLRSDSVVKSLSNPCVSNDPYQCFQKDVNNNINMCEIDVLLKENTNSCQYVTLDIKESYMEMIPEINQYLAVFPKKEVLKFESDNVVEVKELEGIFLIEPVKGNLIFRNQKLHFYSESHGKPTLITNINFQPQQEGLSNIRLKINNMKLNDISLNHILSPDVSDNIKKTEYYTHIVIFLFLMFLLINIIYFKDYIINFLSTNFCKRNVTKFEQEIPITNQNVVLPDKAKF